jgi:hypothetical protein
VTTFEPAAKSELKRKSESLTKLKNFRLSWADCVELLNDQQVFATSPSDAAASFYEPNTQQLHQQRLALESEVDAILKHSGVTNLNLADQFNPKVKAACKNLEKQISHITENNKLDDPLYMDMKSFLESRVESYAMLLMPTSEPEKAKKVDALTDLKIQIPSTIINKARRTESGTQETHEEDIAFARRKAPLKTPDMDSPFWKRTFKMGAQSSTTTTPTSPVRRPSIKNQAIATISNLKNSLLSKKGRSEAPSLPNRPPPVPDRPSTRQRYDTATSATSDSSYSDYSNDAEPLDRSDRVVAFTPLSVIRESEIDKHQQPTTTQKIERVDQEEKVEKVSNVPIDDDSSFSLSDISDPDFETTVRPAETGPKPKLQESKQPSDLYFG